jgi:hypothetical protein
MIRIFFIYFFVGAALVKTNAAFAQNKYTCKIHFEHYVRTEPLHLDSAKYVNDLAQAYSVSMFKYYVGHFCIISKTGEKLRSEKYFLVNEEQPETKSILIDAIPQDDIAAIEFLVGVDSANNCSGAQDGALDPIHAMFWAWNTGYIFLKLEGLSNASKSSGHMLEYHIGGYKAPANCIRRVHIDMAENVKLNKVHDFKIALKVDIAKLFGANNRIDFTKLSSVTDFHNATIIADNYSQMFSMISLN